MRCGASVRLQTRRWPAWCRSSDEFATAVVSLADLKAVREEHEHTINDVVLAMISGGLRSWLLTRGESISSGSSLTALVPMSVTEDDGEPTSLGSQVAPAPAEAADRRAERADAAAPGRVRHPGPQGHRPGGRRPGRCPTSPASRRPPCTRSAFGSRPR